MLTYLNNPAEMELRVGEQYPYSRPLSVAPGKEGAVAYLPANAADELVQIVYFTPLPDEDKGSWATHEMNMVIYQGRRKLTHLVTQIDGMCIFEALPRLPKQSDAHLEQWASGQGRNVLMILVDTHTGRICALREITASEEWAQALRTSVMNQMDCLPAEQLALAVQEDVSVPLWQMMTASTVHLTTSPLHRPLPPLLVTSLN